MTDRLKVYRAIEQAGAISPRQLELRLPGDQYREALQQLIREGAVVLSSDDLRLRAKPHDNYT